MRGGEEKRWSERCMKIGGKGSLDNGGGDVMEGGGEGGGVEGCGGIIIRHRQTNTAPGKDKEGLRALHHQPAPGKG